MGVGGDDDDDDCAIGTANCNDVCLSLKLGSVWKNVISFKLRREEWRMESGETRQGR